MGTTFRCLPAGFTSNNGYFCAAPTIASVTSGSVLISLYFFVCLLASVVIIGLVYGSKVTVTTIVGG